MLLVVKSRAKIWQIEQVFAQDHSGYKLDKNINFDLAKTFCVWRNGFMYFLFCSTKNLPQLLVKD